MKKILLDTNILIDYAHKRDIILNSLLELRFADKALLYNNPIIIAEFIADIQLRDPIQSQKARAFLNRFESVEITNPIAYLAGQFIRERWVTSFADSFIAATCIHHKLELATRNIKDFQKIPGIQLYKTDIKSR